MEEESYHHILYYSPSHIEQLFYDRFGDTTQVVRERETQRSNRILAGLKVFIRGTVEGEMQSRKNIINTVNQEKEYIQTKRVVNELLDDETIPRIRDLKHDELSSFYRFSCECQILAAEDDEYSEAKLVEVVGREDDIKFRGLTSLDNWSSLSDTRMAIQNDIPYPLSGIIQINNINDQVLTEELNGEFKLDQADCDVNFIFICKSGRDEMEKWWSRRDLMGEYYDRYSGS